MYPPWRSSYAAARIARTPGMTGRFKTVSIDRLGAPPLVADTPAPSDPEKASRTGLRVTMWTIPPMEPAP